MNLDAYSCTLKHEHHLSTHAARKVKLVNVMYLFQWSLPSQFQPLFRNHQGGDSCWAGKKPFWCIWSIHQTLNLKTILRNIMTLNFSSLPHLRSSRKTVKTPTLLSLHFGIIQPVRLFYSAGLIFYGPGISLIVTDSMWTVVVLLLPLLTPVIASRISVQNSHAYPYIHITSFRRLFVWMSHTEWKGGWGLEMEEWSNKTCGRIHDIPIINILDQSSTWHDNHLGF